jgi:hypothetical protein
VERGSYPRRCADPRGGECAREIARGGGKKPRHSRSNAPGPRELEGLSRLLRFDGVLGAGPRSSGAARADPDALAVHRGAEGPAEEISGRGSVWLERRVRDAEVGGSNPLAPTTHRLPSSTACCAMSRVKVARVGSFRVGLADAGRSRSGCTSPEDTNPVCAALSEIARGGVDRRFDDRRPLGQTCSRRIAFERLLSLGCPHSTASVTASA